MNYQERLCALRERVAAGLETYLGQVKDAPEALWEAMSYSLLPPGKCIRPILLLEFHRVCGGDMETALPFACALEMIHSYSLIHDDLPCMDNDDLRRGRPTNHKLYGEDMALLAGSSLLSLAFETMLSHGNTAGLPSGRALSAAYCLAEASGARGMAGGQAMDIRFQEETDTQTLYERKTGALFRAASEGGCILAGANPIQIEAARRFGLSLGFAFQLTDDLLDSGEDSQSLLHREGEARCRERIQALTGEALEALRHFKDTGFLAWLANSLSERES